MAITNRLSDGLKVQTAKQLGLKSVWRTDKPASFYAGKAIWGVGRYFSLTNADSEKVNDGGTIQEVKIPSTLRLLRFDLTWSTNKEESDRDYRLLHSLIGKEPAGVDGLVVLSNSMQYGYSQLLVFPRSLHKLPPPFNIKD